MKHHDNKRRWIRRAIASSVPLIGLLLLFSSEQARALELEINGGAPFVCAGVQGAHTANGTAIIATGCTGDFSETWTYKNGTFEGLGTNADTQMCMDVKGNGVVPGTLVDLWPCNGGQINSG